MKLRLAPPHLAQRLHNPMRFGRRWRGHELALRLIQLAVLVVVAGVGAKLIAEGVAMVVHAIGGFIS